MAKSTPKTFQGGLNMDVDPRFQPQGTYRDAQNIKVVSVEGSSFTVENIKGATSKIDLGIDDGNIVGYYSFSDKLVLIHVDGTNTASSTTKIYMYTLNDDGTFSSEVDVNNSDTYVYSANMQMTEEQPVKIVGLIENKAIRRIYWSDNINPVRSINLELAPYALDNYPITTTEVPVSNLDLLPKAKLNAPYLSAVVGGNLKVGVYQYCYELFTTDGASTSISPLSGLYHTTNQTGDYKNTYGSAVGEDSSMGFQIKINSLDTNFEKIVLYAVLYETKDGPSKAYKVGEKYISGNTSATFSHQRLDNELPIEKILEVSNTFDVAKDIAIKDNILFAANTKKTDAFISIDEFDSELKRWKSDGTNRGTRFLSGGSYTRTNQGKDNYRFLPGVYYTNYTKNNNTASTGSTTSVAEYNLLQSGIGEGTILEETFSTSQDGLIVNINQGSNFIHADATGSGLVYDGAEYITYTIVIKVDTNGDGTYDQWWNGSAWQGSSTSFTYTGENPTNYVNSLGGDYALFYDNINILTTAIDGVDKLFVEIESKSINGVSGGSFVTSYTVTNNWLGDTTITANGYSSDGEVNISVEESVTLSEANEISEYSRVLGAQSQGFTSGKGVRMTFKTYPKVSDEVVGQTDDFPFISTNDSIINFDVNNTDSTTFIATQSSSNKDPQMVSLKGYKRGEIYRFGILFYDKKGNPTNTLWMGDVEMPRTYDRNLELIQVTGVRSPYDPTLTTAYQARSPQLNGRTIAEDYRLDVVDGIAVPGYCRTEEYYRDGDVALGNVGNTNKKTNWLFPYTRNSYASSRTFKHYTMDLCCVFDLRFPQSVLNKISGYRIVRAERSEEDSTILQQGLFREAISTNYNTTKKDNTELALPASGIPQDEIIGNSVDSNKLAVHEESQKHSGKYTLGENIITDNNTEVGSPDSNGTKTTESFIFGSNGSQQNYSENSGIGPIWTSVPSFGMLYSPDSIFGTAPYTYQDGDVARAISIIKLKDNTQFATNKAYSFRSHYADTKRFYGKKTINSSDGQDVYVGKTYTVDTQFHRLSNETLEDGSNGIKFYTETDSYGNYYSGADFTTSNDAKGLYNAGSELNDAKELNDGDSHNLESSSLDFHNVSFGSTKPIAETNADLTITGAYHSYVKSYTTIGYEVNKSIQKGNRGISVDVSDKGTFRIPNLDRALIGSDRQILFDDSMRSKKSPYMILGEIEKSSSYKEGVYGGVEDSAIYATRYIQAGDFVPVRDSHVPTTKFQCRVAGGDTYVSIFSHQLTMSHFHPDGSAAKVITFPVESRTNVEMRSGQHLASGFINAGFFPDVLPNKNDILYNQVYSQEANLKGYLSVNEKKKPKDENQPIQISYSKTKLSGESEDSFRQFPAAQFYEMDNDTGEINGLINFRDDLYVFQDNGFAKLFINSRTLIGGQEGILLGSASTIENHAYISKQYGSIHREGILATDNAIYFIDAKNSKIHRFTGSLQTISDKGISKFLNQDIFVTNSTLASKVKNNTYPRVETSQLVFAQNANGVSIGYDQNEKRVIFTFASYHDSQQNKKSISFNEYIDGWESKLDFCPPLWIMHDGKLYSHGRLPAEMGSSNVNCDNVYLFDSDASNRGLVVDLQKEQFIEIVINDGPTDSKKFDAVEVIGDVDTSGTVNLTGAAFSTDKVSEQSTTFATDLIHKVREGILRFPLRGKTATKRLVGSYALVKLKNNNTTKFSIFAIVPKIRKSFK